MSINPLQERRRNVQLDHIERLREYPPEMGRFERFGAKAMSFFGRTNEMAASLFTGTPLNEMKVSALRMNAYGNHREHRFARKTWAVIGGLAVIASLNIGEKIANQIEDNVFACSGNDTAILTEGSNLYDLAEQIPHENTALAAVVNKIAQMNPNMVGRDLSFDEVNPDEAKSGEYITPSDCNSYFPKI